MILKFEDAGKWVIKECPASERGCVGVKEQKNEEVMGVKTTKTRKLVRPDIKPELTPNALRVLERRYLRKDEEGNVVETPEEMFWRVATTIASADLIYDPEADVQKVAEEFYEFMVKLDFLPNSPTLMNAGRELGQLSACFVLPIEDSMDAIFETLKHTALIHKSGGGTGFSFSRLRPHNDIVRSTSGISSGPVSFMQVFDAATEAIKQGGTRRGANMAVLRYDHPDILDFITAKRDLSRLTNFNISVATTGDFMEKVRKNEKYALINPRTKQPTGYLSAKEVFDLMTQVAWETGDPGVIFIDRINQDNPTPEVGEIESTNPCGEQPLLPYESCNLGSVNLAHMVKNGGVDYDRLRTTVRRAIHFLDNVIDKNRFPLPQIEKMTKANRKIGLGVMGFADMLIKLDIAYNSEEALKLAEEVMHFIQVEANAASMALADERGEFPNFKKSIYYHENGPKYRNATRTTIAPTGTISIIAGTSSGIEPLFAVAFVRNVLDGDRLVEIHPLFEKMIRESGLYSDELMRKVAEEGSVQNLAEIPENLRRLFVTAHDITPEWHVRMQAAFQKHTDNAVSKTVNFRKEATVEDVRKVYQLAYDLGCKGITIYRDGCRDQQVLNKGIKKEEKAEERPRAVKRERPEVLHGETIRMQTGCGPLYVTINEDEQGPFEVFNTMGKAGGCVASQTEAIGRLASLALRSGVSIDEIIKQLGGIRCHRPFGFGKNQVLSCSDAVAKALLKYKAMRGNGHFKQKTAEAKPVEQVQQTKPETQPPQEVSPAMSIEVEITGSACPECGSTLEYTEGCVVCRSCGYSECE